MSGLYGQAMQEGMQAGELLLSGENAGTRAAFNSAYAAAARRLAAADLKNTAEKNISAIRRDRILTNIEIQKRQDQAEAMAKVNAAAAGVAGQNTDDVIYQTEVNEAHALSRAKRQSEQQVESQLARINSAQSTLLSVQDSRPSLAGELLTAFSSLTTQDLKIGESLANNPDSKAGETVSDDSAQWGG